MSELEKKEFEEWFSSQSLELMDYLETDMYCSTQEQLMDYLETDIYCFTQEQLMEFTRKAWEKSREQVTKVLQDGTKEEIKSLYDSIHKLKNENNDDEEEPAYGRKF